MHGYEVIQELESGSGGRWRPSAGSVYPTLQQLADEGLVTSEEVDGRRTYTLTAEGREAAEAAPAAHPSWADDDARDGDVRQVAIQLVGAAMEVQRMGSSHARREAGRVLADARRQLYRILAEDEAVDEGAGEPAPGAPPEET
jgi:DNA-binding PadR family transcriptional regulator